MVLLFSLKAVSRLGRGRGVNATFLVSVGDGSCFLSPFSFPGISLGTGQRVLSLCFVAVVGGSRPDSLNALWDGARAFGAGVVLSGAIWGCLGVFFFLTDSTLLQLTTIFMLAGMGAGATAVYSAASELLYFYLVPSMAPLLLGLAFANRHAYMVLVLPVGLFTYLLTKIGTTTQSAARGSDAAQS